MNTDKPCWGASGIDRHGAAEGHMTPAVSDCENQTQENSSYIEKQGEEMPRDIVPSREPP